MFKKIFVLGFLSLLLFVGNTIAAAIVNPGFDTGNHSDLSIYTTSTGANGVGEPAEIAFQTAGGINSNGAQFEVGLASGNIGGGNFLGSGIYQTLFLTSGSTLSADVAVNNAYSSPNVSGGVSSLFMGPTIIDTAIVTRIDTCVARYAHLFGTKEATDGMYKIGISPYQYVDNFELSSTNIPAGPEPASIPLLGAGICALVLAALRRKKA
jgi:hypothetical protein